MDLDGRRASYSFARMLEEVQEQKTKEQQLRRSLLVSDLSPDPAATAAAADAAVSARNTEDELPFQPGFVSQLLGKFGGPVAAASGRLAKASSVQNLAAVGSSGGVLLRHPEKTRGVSVASPRRSSQDGLGELPVTNGNGIAHDANGTLSSPSSSSPSPSISSPSVPLKLPPAAASAGKDRVLIISKASAPPVVRRLHHHQQQQRQYQQQSSIQPLKPAAPVQVAPIATKATESISPSETTPSTPAGDVADYVLIPSDTSLPIRNIVQAKRCLFEQPQQHHQPVVISSRHRNGSGSSYSLTPSAKVATQPPSPAPYGAGSRTSHQSVFGRSVTRQIVPRTVEIVNASEPSPQPPPPMSLPQSAPLPAPTPMIQPPKAAVGFTSSILPSRPSAVVAASSAPPAKKPVQTQPPPLPPMPTASTTNGSADDYGFGLPVPKLKSSLPFNGENLKRVQLSEQSVAAMRKAGKSWFFGTDVSAAPEGTIAVKLTPNSSVWDYDADDYEHHVAESEADELTEERRAQTTVWDHLRDSGQRRVAIDPALEAEARRLMASSGADADVAADVDAAGEAAGDDAATEASDSSASSAVRARKKAKKLCFKRDSALEETYEYQSEQSLIDELQIMPDYLTDPFDTESPNESGEEDSGGAASESDRGSSAGQVALPAASVTASLTTYKAKAADEFVWGARSDPQPQQPQQQPQQRTDTADAVDYGASESAGSVDDPDAQWSASATSDLLF